MGRHEAPLDPAAGPVQGFASELRKLRTGVQGLTYRVMAQRTPYTISTLSRAAAGDQLPSLEVTLAYVAACGADRREWERRWRKASEETARQAAEDDDTEPPYKGLARFEPGDHERFFGRDRLVDDLVGLVRTHRVVVVVGASGSGKSSLLRAGLIPRLRSAEEPYRPVGIRILAPGERPARTHTATLAPMGGEGDTVVVVDQFEEVFTLCRAQKERAEFLDRLLDARRAGSRLRVVIAVRADFFGQCAEHPALADACRDATVLVGPMSTAELRDVIIKPAMAAGVVVERSLTARLVSEASGEPGGLPLLSHALLEAWRQRRGQTLTKAVYDSVGGLRGAVARTAEDACARLTDAQTDLARRILLRLISPGDGTLDTRRSTRRAELTWTADQAETATVLDCLARARLITLDEEVVELAHEALITAWPRLRDWVAEDRERLRLQRRLTEAARTWEELDRDEGALYRGARLAAVRDWAAHHRIRSELTAFEHVFLDASIALEDDERAVAVRRGRRLACLAACLAVLLIVVTGVSVVAVRQRHKALESRQIATSQQLASQALNLADSRPGTAMLLSIEAFRTEPTLEARGALLSMSARRSYQAELTSHADAVSEVAFSRDGTLASVGRDGKAVLWDARRRTRLATLTGHATWLRAVDFSPDGRWMATGGDDRKVVLWNVASRTRVATLTGHRGSVKSVAFSPDGRTLAGASDDGTVILWDTESGRQRLTLTGHGNTVWAVDFSPDGRLLATASTDRTVRLWDAATGEQLAVLRGHTRSVDAVGFSPDSHTLATASQDYTVRLWDVRRHTQVATLRGHSAEVRAVAFSPDGSTVATSGQDHTVILWDIRNHTRRTTLLGQGTNVYTLAYSRNGSLLASAGESGAVTLWAPTHIPLSGHMDRVNKVVFRPDGRLLATAGQDGTAALWDVTGTRRSNLAVGHGPVRSVAFSPDGRTLAAASYDGRVTLWSVARRTRTATLTGHTGQVSAVAFSPDGKTLATAGIDQTVILWDVAGHKRLATLASDTGPAFAVAFSPDGHTLATANADTSVMLWDVVHRRQLATLTGHTAQVRVVAFSPDGRTLATAGDDRTVRLWNTDPRLTVTQLCTSLSRDLSRKEWKQLITGIPYHRTCDTG
ncbi:WD40 repeat domain-containing protein [Streptomyces sp. NBC_01433]|uniref:WD40 repeat domain-containing protein n=1 Tax=Streptomyces sp. NBC_01433 TaxID=2903864 RepID=UPI002255C525|nr:WD40 repeat domain-containing protein [Streptomyces sp. NBC_01433]MCX4679202.1 WD40 repeat domain-containing protein [Streptomyces sp. NBC_01433]